MFVKHELATKIITDFDNLYEEMLFEFILVEIETKSETLLCSVLYRPPCGSPAKFLESLDKLLSSMLSRYKKLLFMGDFNIDLLAPSKLKQAQNNSSLANEFISSFLSTGMLPACRIPTRVTDTTASLIDNLFTNLDLKTCDVIIYDDSDHFLILSEVTLDKPKVEQPERKTRKLDAESIESLRNQLNNINRSPCLDNQDVDQATNYFIQEFEKAFDRACPAKTSKSRRQEPRKPWISKGIVRSFKIKNQLYKIRIENPSEDNKEKFRLYKNNLTKVIRAAKASHYTKLFAEASSSPKKSWEIIHGIIGKKKMSKFPESINHGPELVSDRPGIANVFNKHFANVGIRTVKESVAANNSEQRNKVEDYLPPSSLSSLFLTPTSKEELINIVNLLKPGGAEGIDGSSTRLLKLIIANAADLLVHIVNICFRSGKFPSCLKSARVIVLHIGVDPKDPFNYRPISILSAFEKVIERCIYKRVNNFLEKHKYFSKSQFGFRKSHSTEQAILAVTQYIHDALERGEIPASIFIDIKKAFDTICHKILRRKLENCGIRGPANNLIMSFLSERSQYVDADTTRSELISLDGQV